MFYEEVTVLNELMCLITCYLITQSETSLFDLTCYKITVHLIDNMLSFKMMFLLTVLRSHIIFMRLRRNLNLQRGSMSHFLV
jgi:hypothetical protein